MIEFFTSSTFRTVLSALNSGFLKTLQLFFITLIGALPLGLVISFGSMSRFPPLRWLTRLVVWVIRGTPLVLQIIALFYVPGVAPVLHRCLLSDLQRHRHGAAGQA